VGLSIEPQDAESIGVFGRSCLGARWTRKSLPPLVTTTSHNHEPQQLAATTSATTSATTALVSWLRPVNARVSVTELLLKWLRAGLVWWDRVKRGLISR